MCNEFVADLTGSDVQKKPEEGMSLLKAWILVLVSPLIPSTVLRQLVMLNLILHGQENAGEDIAKQRVIFFIKHVIQWLQDDTVDLSTQAEICRSMSILLPLMGDIYGSHWAEILQYLTSTWTKTQQLSGNEFAMDR